MAQQVMNSNIIHDERDWIPGLTLLSKDPDLQGGAKAGDLRENTSGLSWTRCRHMLV